MKDAHYTQTTADSVYNILIVFLQYDILKQAGIKIPIFIDNFHFQTVNIDGMYSNWGYG